MKRRGFTFLLSMLMSMMGVETFAYDAKVNGIYYNFSGSNAVVTYYSSSSNSNAYSGAVTIPETVTYNNTTYSVTSIDYRAFSYCSGLTSVTIPNSVTSIGEDAFSGCSGLTSVTIPNSVTSIGSDAFYDCSGLKEVNFNATNCTSMGSSYYPVFRNCTSLATLNIGDNVKNIPDYAFYGCSGLERIVIPNSVTSIGTYAFRECSLKSATIGAGVLSIGSNVFYINNPAKVIWLTNTPPSGYSNAAGTVNYVANNQYSSLSNKTVYPLLSSLFEVGGVVYAPISFSERTCDAIDCLYNDGAEHINIGEKVTYMNVEMTVKQVHPYACYQNKHIKDVQLTLNGNIGNYAFYNSDGMTTATIANTGAIGNNVFRSCAKLQTATLGDKVTGIGENCFSDCSKLADIVIPNSVTTIGQYAFYNCSSMESVHMGTGVSTIEIYTFSGCSKLSDMQIGTKVGTIKTYAFYNCTSLQEIVIPQSVTNINNSVFTKCTALKELSIADRNTILTLGYNDYYSSNNDRPLFKDCPLETVYIGGNISYNTTSSYGYSPFYRNTSLKSVTITDEETEISPNEFYGCTSLKNVSIGDGVTTIGNWAFSGCSSLDFFAFGSKVSTIGQEAFSDCTAMTRLISSATTPPTCGSEALHDIVKWTCTLEVPTGRKEAYKAADQWKEFVGITEGNGTNQPYRLTYVVDGETYKIVSWQYGAEITPEPAPVKDGYTFSGWSEIPATMPAENITVTGTFTPDQQNSVTVTARSYTVQYGDAIPALGYTSTGAVLNGTPQLTCEGGQGSSVGTYTITASRGTVTNQNDSYVNGTLTITRAPLTISAGTYTRVQGEENPTFTLSYDGLKMGETAATALTHQATATTLATTTSEPGQYRVTVSGAESDNYDIVYVNGTLTVTAAPETVDTENMLIINNLETSKGKTVALPVSMTNTKQIAGFQFDLTLPAGVSVATNSNGKYVTTLSTRAGDHTVSATSLGNNTYRFVVTSMGGDVFAMGEGTVITVMLKVESTVADGNYTMKVKSELTGKEGSTMTRIIAADSQATLTVTSVKPGDANGDGFVTVTDVICIISEVLNETPDGFIRTAADVNGDGVVTVTDAIIVIDMVLNNGKTSNARRMMRQVPDPQ